MDSGTASYEFCLFCTIVDHKTLYWLFSTFAQSYGAIVGLLGLFVVYRFERQSIIREDIRKRVLKDETLTKKPDNDSDSPIIQIFGRKVIGMSPDEINDHYQEKIKESQKKALKELKDKKDLDYQYLHEEMKRINNSIGITKRLEKSSLRFFPIHFLFIIASIFCIFFAHGLAKYAPWVIWITIICLLVSGVLTWNLARALIITTGKKAFPFKDPLSN